VAPFFKSGGKFRTGFSEDETKGHAHHQKQGGMAEQLRSLNGAEFERQFLSKMIQHHKDGVEAASMAVQKAQKPEIKQLAQKNVDQQKKEIEQMTGWLQSWYQDSPKQPSPDDPMMKKAIMTRSELAQAQGREFDKKFLTSFTDHHRDAIPAADMAKQKATRDELKQAGAKMANDQREDVKKMEAWQRELQTASNRQ
jgi:uncharacterized protein (DUF305 family)